MCFHLFLDRPIPRYLLFVDLGSILMRECVQCALYLTNCVSDYGGKLMCLTGCVFRQFRVLVKGSGDFEAL